MKGMAVACALLGTLTVSAQLSETQKNDQDIFDVSKNIEILTEVLYNLQTYSLYDIDPNTITQKGLSAMTGSLDPYTRYYSESDIQDYLYQRTGKYEGLGLSFFKGVDSSIVISEIIEGGEAENSGLSIGDTIISVNGVDLAPMNVSAVRDYFQKVDGENIELQIQKVYKGTREKILIDKGVVTKNKLGYSGWLKGNGDRNISIIKLNKFTPDCAAMVESALDSLYLENPDMKGIVLDLRSNPGGLLIEAVRLVNLFVGSGKLVVYTQGKIADDVKKYHTKENAKFEDQELYVLIDSHSASASEIVSGALQDYDRAVVIGENSYGKGLVQNFKQLPFHTQMKLTTAKYYIPSGRCIQTLDYGDKDENGNPYNTPENKRKKFKTANGREVLDGRGVTPDVQVNIVKNDILQDLEQQHIIFGFVSAEVDIAQVEYKPQVDANLDKYLASFYDWLGSNDVWKTLPFYTHWGELVKSNASSKMLSNAEVQGFEKTMYNGLVNKIRDVEDELKVKIKEEILRRKMNDYDYYEQNMSQDQYFTQVEVINKDGKKYQKILQP